MRLLPPLFIFLSSFLLVGSVTGKCTHEASPLIALLERAVGLSLAGDTETIPHRFQDSRTWTVWQDGEYIHEAGVFDAGRHDCTTSWSPVIENWSLMTCEYTKTGGQGSEGAEIAYGSEGLSVSTKEERSASIKQATDAAFTIGAFKIATKLESLKATHDATYSTLDFKHTQAQLKTWCTVSHSGKGCWWRGKVDCTYQYVGPIDQELIEQELGEPLPTGPDEPAVTEAVECPAVDVPEGGTVGTCERRLQSGEACELGEADGWRVLNLPATNTAGSLEVTCQPDGRLSNMPAFGPKPVVVCLAIAPPTGATAGDCTCPLKVGESCELAAAAGFQVLNQPATFTAGTLSISCNADGTLTPMPGFGLIPGNQIAVGPGYCLPIRIPVGSTAGTCTSALRLGLSCQLAEADGYRVLNIPATATAGSLEVTCQPDGNLSNLPAFGVNPGGSRVLPAAHLTDMGMTGGEMGMTGTDMGGSATAPAMPLPPTASPTGLILPGGPTMGGGAPMATGMNTVPVPTAPVVPASAMNP